MVHRAGWPSELHVLVPFWGMSGGVIKILDYANHALAVGVPRVRLWAPPPPTADAPLNSVPVVSSLVESDRVTVELLPGLDLDVADPWVLFTEPAHHELIEARASQPLLHRLIHLVQGTRHANPEWNNGLHYRLLHRPMSRVTVSEQVTAAVRPHVNDRFPLKTIVEGHDLAYFADGAPERSGARSVLRVLYTTWKSDLGDRVAAIHRNNPGLTFDVIRRECGWPELRRRYHDADIFLCTPGPEEGFYLPGLEAMAAGCAVVGAVVGGNAAYMRDGENVVEVEYDSAAEHAAAVAALADDGERRRRLVLGGRATSEQHQLHRERSAFGELVRTLVDLETAPQLP